MKLNGHIIVKLLEKFPSLKLTKNNHTIIEFKVPAKLKWVAGIGYVRS